MQHDSLLRPNRPVQHCKRHLRPCSARQSSAYSALLARACLQAAHLCLSVSWAWLLAVALERLSRCDVRDAQAGARSGGSDWAQVSAGAVQGG